MPTVLFNLLYIKIFARVIKSFIHMNGAVIVLVYGNPLLS